MQMTSQVDTLFVNMHGVTLTLEADNPRLMGYASEHLKGLMGPPTATPNLHVKCFWTQGHWDAQANPFSTNGAFNIIGKRMLGNANDLIWLDTLRMDGLQLRFMASEEKRWTFEVAYCFHPEKGKLEKLPEYEYKKYFSLMSYLVYYPLTWYLERYRGWTLLHASALVSEKGGIIIGGLGGVGKTTACVALLQRVGFELVSENLLFTDGEFLYPCYEPIRLDEKSLAMLGDKPAKLTPMRFPEGLKKKWLFHLNSQTIPQKVKPLVLFLPQFTPRRFVKELAPELALEKIMAINRLTRELDDYYWYASALEMHWPWPGQAQQRIDALRHFVQQVRCIELGIDQTAGIEAMVKDILNCIEKLA